LIRVRQQTVRGGKFPVAQDYDARSE